MTNPSTTLPTEPGIYLFCGFRDGEKLDVRDIPTLRGTEVVRVTRNAQGQITYVGSDFFYRPEAAIGSWLPISEEAAALHALALETVIAQVTRTRVIAAFTSNWSPGRNSKEGVISHLTGPFRSPDVIQEAHVVFDRAVEMGLIVPEDARGYAGWWKLATTV